MREVLKLFWQFFRFGCFTFGGGWSIIAQMQEIYVEKEKSVRREEIIDITSVGRSLPGTMIGNVAMLFGYSRAGFAGGVAAVTGMVIPPMLVLIVLTYGYSFIETNPWVIAAMSGIRAAICPIIISAVMGMVKGAFAVRPCYLITFAAAAIYIFTDLSCVYIILFGALCGLLITEIMERRGMLR